jgi:hypothetical protein
MKNQALQTSFEYFPEVRETLQRLPRYQEFMQAYEIASLPPKLREIVLFLKDQKDGMTAGGIATGLGVSAGSRQVSIQLREILSRTDHLLTHHRYGVRGGLYWYKQPEK